MNKLICKTFAVLACVCCLQISIPAQQPTLPIFAIKDGKMIIEYNKIINENVLDSFISKYKLFDIPLKHFFKTKSTDSLQKSGWKINVNNNEKLEISKPLFSFDDINNPEDKFLFMDKLFGLEKLFAPKVSHPVFGYNQFTNKSDFAVSDSMVTFYLRNHHRANRVMLAGSFNGWNPEALPMTKTDSGWIAYVKLLPGKYWYKFITDGNWMVDNDNQQKENDGEGNINSVYYKTNINFTFNPPDKARRVYLSGSFNNWKEKDILMNKAGEIWHLPVYLGQGTHTYKFIADRKWYSDPNNPDKLNDGNNGFNTVIKLGKTNTFRLAGYPNAKRIVLSGTFNGWKEDELFMNKTANGWELPYVIAPGNYQYKFIVDDEWITDPSNPITVNNEHNTENSFLIIEANYTFRLKGFDNAKQVFLAGEFNGWSSNSFAMKRIGDEWIFNMHLSPGKLTYKFVVDGEWIIDPHNPLWEQNEHDTGNSVLWIKNPLGVADFKK